MHTHASGAPKRAILREINIKLQSGEDEQINCRDEVAN